MPERTYFEERLKTLKADERKAEAMLYAFQGARQECEATLREFDKEAMAAAPRMKLVPSEEPPPEQETG